MEKDARWFRKVEYRLYPNATQVKLLVGILSECGGLYNTLLEHEIELVKAGRRRRPSSTSTSWLRRSPIQGRP